MCSKPWIRQRSFVWWTFLALQHRLNFSIKALLFCWKILQTFVYRCITNKPFWNCGCIFWSGKTQFISFKSFRFWKKPQTLQTVQWKRSVISNFLKYFSVSRSNLAVRSYHINFYASTYFSSLLKPFVALGVHMLDQKRGIQNTPFLIWIVGKRSSCCIFKLPLETMLQKRYKQHYFSSKLRGKLWQYTVVNSTVFCIHHDHEMCSISFCILSCTCCRAVYLSLAQMKEE